MLESHSTLYTEWCILVVSKGKPTCIKMCRAVKKNLSLKAAVHSPDTVLLSPIAPKHPYVAYT